MVEGRVTGIQDGAITGWIAAAAAPDLVLEALEEGGAPFGRTRPEAEAEGRRSFSIPIPPKLRDGRMRFLDVRPLGERRPLAGGPVIYDGGLLEPGPAGAGEAEQTRPSQGPLAVEGEARFEPPRSLSGWAWAPEEPARRVRLEILAGGRLIAVITADKPLPDLAPAGAGDGRYGFQVDLARLLRRGPHEIVVRPAGSAEPLAGGRFSAGPFAADGEVDCPGYLEEDAERALLAALPFEHLAHDALRVSPERLVPRLINRLRRERLAAQTARATLLLLPGPAEPRTAEVWALQSLPATAVVPAADGAAAIRQAAEAADHVLFAGPGDLIHPSTGSIVARLDADLVSWNRFLADGPGAGSAGLALRRPPADPITARHGALTDTTLALRGRSLAAAPDAVLAALTEGRLQPLWSWLAGQPIERSHHPEALTASIGERAPIPRAEVEADEALLRTLLGADGADFTLERTRESLPFPFALLPRRRAAGTSVLVSFRNRSALTLRCLYSLSTQVVSGEIELVLVDNGSEPAEAEAVVEGARRLLGAQRVTALRHDGPFSHSAQTNLAARAAAGEALLICNNDVVLSDPGLVEQLSAWALQPGIGAVGCRLWDPERRRGSYGLISAAPGPDPFTPPLRENDDERFAGYVHAVPGATLALAAMARERFLDLGGLDETRFPVGYNDIDLMLRARAAGLTHLYLGHVEAEHVRGSSRTGDNEDLQALWLRQAHGAASWLEDLAAVRVGPVAEAPAERGDGEADAELLAALQAAAAARAEVELRRAELAEGLARAAGLAEQLGQELKGTR